MRKLQRRRRLLAIGVAGIVLILAPLTAVTGAAPAAAAPAAPSGWCVRTGFFPTSIGGYTFNYSDVALTRTFTEKGVTNSWHPEPAAKIKSGGIDRWCVNAQFGSAMRVAYKTPDGTTVIFTADQYVLSNPNASCDVSGPSARALACQVRISKPSFDDSEADFAVYGKGDVGLPPRPGAQASPTPSSAILGATG
jgi:hypothetical protein